MAVRLDENSITQGSIDNRTRGETFIKLAFTDGYYTEITLSGNPYRDIAGRLVTLLHTNPDEALAHERALVPIDTGAAGDITAARKVKAPTISLKETGEYYLKKKKIPYVWKNSLYLEWYTLNGGRCVLEATELQITSSEPEWIMTDDEEKQAHQDAQKGLSLFLSMFGNIDKSRAKLDKTLDENDGDLDEFGWEQLFKHSDKASDRYRELLDKYDEDSDKIDEEMGWNTSSKENEVPESQLDPFNTGDHWKIGNNLEPDPEFEADIEAQRNHPLRTKAHEILTSLESPKEQETPELGETWAAVALVGAKLAGALSGYRRDGSYDDNGFVIAQLKRVLNHLNEAYELMLKEDHPKRPSLMELRQDIVDLQTKLRAS